MNMKARSSDGTRPGGGTSRLRCGVISTADRPGPNYELFPDVASFPSPPVNGGRQPIREVRGGQGQVHGRSIANETQGWRHYHSVVSVAAISGLIAARS